MPDRKYIGRFAPTPSGPLHFGSLLAALTSYLDAKAHQGVWQVRIENLDPPRESITACQQFPFVLDAYGLHWDGEITYQSDRHDLYQNYLNRLAEKQLAFPCQCSRKQLDGLPHRGNCHCLATEDIAWRFLCPNEQFNFVDRVQGPYCVKYNDLGDFILKRRDGFWAYQLAVVCDDIEQGITHVLRGVDLIDSCARQALLYNAFEHPLPTYAHIPVATEVDGQKLSKQNLARPIETSKAAETIYCALQWLRQNPPAELANNHTELLAWAVEHWNIDALKGWHEALAPKAFQRK